MLPQNLKDALGPITVIVGHYGVGKTNFTVNLALDGKASFDSVTVIDLDIINPYFRASEHRSALEAEGVRVIAPIFAEAGSSLDVPSLSGAIGPALMDAKVNDLVLIDAGGDDAGIRALGRFLPLITGKDPRALGVINHFRNLTQSPEEAVDNLREIVFSSNLPLKALVDNSHLKGETSEVTIQEGYDFALGVSKLMGIPLACVCIPEGLVGEAVPDYLRYKVNPYGSNPWEI